MMNLINLIEESDFSALAADPVLFVKAFDTRKPWPFQADILRKVAERDVAGKFQHRVSVVSLPRQNSKSTISAWIAVWRLFTAEEQEIVSVANDQAQASIIFNDGKKLISGSPLLCRLVDRFTRHEIKLKNGNRWIIKSADSVSSRGLRPSLVCYDELGWVPDRDLFDVLSAGQAARRNPLTVVTSTVGPVQDGILWNLFEMAKGGDPTILLIYHNENLSPLISEEYLEQQKVLLPSHIFAREHNNNWGTGSDAFCSLDQWQAATVGPDPRRFFDRGPCYAFLDLGWFHNESALAVAKKEENIILIVHLEFWQGSQSEPVVFASIRDRILELKRNLNISRLIIESPQGIGLAQELSQMGLSANIRHPTAKGNRETWGALYTALKNKSIRLPNDNFLKRQLLTLTIKSGPTGWKVEDAPTIHNDRAVAVAGAVLMAMQPGVSYEEYLRQEYEKRQKPEDYAEFMERLNQAFLRQHLKIMNEM